MVLPCRGGHTLLPLVMFATDWQGEMVCGVADIPGHGVDYGGPSTAALVLNTLLKARIGTGPRQSSELWSRLMRLVRLVRLILEVVSTNLLTKLRLSSIQVITKVSLW